MNLVEIAILLGLLANFALVVAVSAYFRRLCIHRDARRREMDEIGDALKTGRGRLFVIMSLPKCGGSSLALSLKRSFPGAEVFHVHVQSQKGFNKMADWIRTAKDPANQSVVRAHLRAADQVRVMRTLVAEENTCIFAGVREPVSFALSDFFQRYFTYDEPERQFSTDQIREAIEAGDVFPNSLLELDCWFEEELAPVAGFNVLDREFPLEKGFEVYDEGRSKLCVYRLEDFDAIGAAVARSTGLPEEMIEIVTGNTAEGKEYAARYSEVKKGIKFSPDFLEKVYSSRFARHFYTDEERSRFMKRWLRS